MEADSGCFLAVGDADEVIGFVFVGGEHQELVEVPFASVVGAAEDEAFVGEHDDALIFIYLELDAGNNLAFHGADSETDSAADGDRDTC